MSECSVCEGNVKVTLKNSIWVIIGYMYRPLMRGGLGPTRQLPLFGVDSAKHLMYPN